MIENAPVLVVDDDSMMLRTIARALQPHWAAVPASCVEEGRAFLEQRRFSAAIIDVFLPDGSGFDLLEMIRTRSARAMPVLMFTGCVEMALVNRAQILGAEIAIKGDGQDSVRAFQHRLAERPPLAHDVATALARDHGFSPRATHALTLALEEPDATREDKCARLRIAPSTYKGYVKQILGQTGDDSLSVLRRRLRRDGLW
jgi:ActR/RegA family two-component response regulator